MANPNCASKHSRRECFFNLIGLCADIQIFMNEEENVEIKHKRFVLTSTWKPTPEEEIPHLVLISSDELAPEAKNVRQLHHLLPTRNDKKAVRLTMFFLDDV